MALRPLVYTRRTRVGECGDGVGHHLTLDTEVPLVLIWSGLHSVVLRSALSAERAIRGDIRLRRVRIGRKIRERRWISYRREILGRHQVGRLQPADQNVGMGHIVKNARAGSNRGLMIGERVPGYANARVPVPEERNDSHRLS